MNCLYEMTEEILADAEVLSPGWSRDENLFSKSATLERERKMIAADTGAQRVERILRR